MAKSNTPPKEVSIPWSTRNKSESTKASKPVKPPSPSSSIILVSPANRILLLHRVQTSSSFPSAHVFPGGNLEPSDGPLPSLSTDLARHKDSHSYRTGAIRELFEESGILLARQNATPDSPLLILPPDVRLKGRSDIHAHNTTITSWLSSQSPEAVLDTGSLIPFTRWITPTNVPKRFTTQMYIYFLPTSAQDDKSLVATSDEVETMAPEWRFAKDWLNQARDGHIILFPPQFLLLSFVSDFLDVPTDNKVVQEAELNERRERLKIFINNDGSPPWRDKIISPTALSFTRADGRTVLGLDKPGPELKDAKEAKGDDTRVVLVKFQKEGPRDVEVGLRREIMEEERRAKNGCSKL